MRPTGIFASNVKQCLTKPTAYEKGKKTDASRYFRPIKQTSFLTIKTNRPKWTKLSKQTIQFFKTI